VAVSPSIGPARLSVPIGRKGNQDYVVGSRCFVRASDRSPRHSTPGPRQRHRSGHVPLEIRVLVCEKVSGTFFAYRKTVRAIDACLRLTQPK